MTVDVSLSNCSTIPASFIKIHAKEVKIRKNTFLVISWLRRGIGAQNFQELFTLSYKIPHIVQL
jgi:hypothetical protein